MPVFVHRFFSYTPCKPRHPLLRLLVGLIGLSLLLVLVTFGLFVGVFMLMFAAVRRMRRRHTENTAPESAGHVFDAEYSVVSKPRASIGAG